MQFSQELMKKVTEQVEPFGITLEQSEVTSALSNALAMFTGPERTLPTSSSQGVIISAAAKALNDAFHPEEAPENTPETPPTEA